MSMTDPIADFLTRVRNGITAAHEEVEIPSSKLKREMARILKEQGYIRDFEVEAPTADRPSEIIRVTLKYTDERRSAITGLKRVSRPGQRHLRRPYRDSQGAGRHGDGDRVHLEGRDDRPRSPRRGRRRRGRRARVVIRSMSRIGKKPIPVPAGVTISIEPELVRVNGPKGELTERIHRDIAVEQEGEELLVKRPTDRGEHRALHGLTRSLVANMVEGVTNGFEKRLEIQGVGYRAQLKGKDLELALGYSHPVPVKAPDGIEFEVPQPTRVVVKGISKQQVGEIAAFIRKQRPPEPYKGKGIRYEGEYVARKVGKRA